MNTKQNLINEVLADYDEKVIALAQYLGLNLDIDFNDEDYPTEDYTEEEMEEAKQEAMQELRNTLDDIRKGYSNNHFEYYGEEYEILTDDEADARWEEELNNYIEECILPELPYFVANYFDEEAWKRDARFDGRGQSISRYDGCENAKEVNGTWYFIYRQN